MSITNPLTYLLILAGLGAVAKIFMWVGAINTERESWKGAIDRIDENIKTILGFITPATVMPGSPTKLTELGASIAKEINAQELARALVGELVSEADGKHPYEVEKLCFAYVKACKLTDEQRNLIYTAAYAHGLDDEDVLDVVAVELRDELIKSDKD